MNKIDVKQEFRSADSLQIADSEKRIFSFSGSSELPVARVDYSTGETYMEILDHSPENVDLSAIRDGGPFLFGHHGDQIGVIESVTVENKRTNLTVRLSKREQVSEIWQDIQDGIRRGISCGYEKTRILSSEMIDGIRHIRFAWKPFEFSLVTIPADPTVGVGRSAPENEKHTLEFAVSPSPVTFIIS